MTVKACQRRAGNLSMLTNRNAIGFSPNPKMLAIMMTIKTNAETMQNNEKNIIYGLNKCK